MNSIPIILSFSCILGIFIFIGVLASRTSSGTEGDYLLGSRSFGKYFIGIGAGAAANSGFIMVGMVGMGYSLGVSSLLFPLGALIGDLVFWKFFPARVHSTAQKYNCYTVPELLSIKSTGNGMVSIRSIAAIIAIVFVGLFATGQLLAAGKVVAATFNLPLVASIFIATLVIVGYCAKGGLRASVWNSFIQGILIIFTVFGLLFVSLSVGGGFSNVVDTLHAIDPGLLQISNGYTLWTAFFLLLGLAGMAFGFDLSAPHFIVRILSGRSAEDVKSARWIYLSFLYLTWAGMGLFGIVLRTVLPELSDPEHAVAIFSTQHLNPWITGVIMAGVFSAIASTLGGQLLAISSSIAVDVAPRWHERMMKRFGTRYQYITTLLVGLLLIVVASNITSTVFYLILFSGAALAAVFAPVMVIVVMNLKTSPIAIFCCIISTLLVAIVWRLLGLSEFMLEALPGLVTGLLVNAIITRLSSVKRVEEGKERLI